MPGANFPRLKNWTSTEDVTAADLNAEFDNILNNLTAANVDDFSANVSQMQSSTDPGEVGSESLATSVAGEIQRIRFLLTEITGSEEWYESPVSSILGLANAIGTGLTANRIVSGKVRSTSQQPLFLVPDGAARTITVDVTPNLVYYIDSIEYSIITDTTLTNLTAAPSSNNTCAINDANAAGQYWTAQQGEDGTEIPIDTVGSEISALVGKFAAFKIGAEYFFAYVKSTTALSKCRRGFFFDSTGAPLPRVTYSDNDVITLVKLSWIYAKSDLTLTVTYNNPIWAKDEPSSPAIGDYWFDLQNNTWKTYTGTAFVTANANFIGMCVQNTTATIAARSFDFFKGYDDINTIELTPESNTQVKSRFIGSKINVFGASVLNDYNLHTWDMTLDLDTGVTEAASTYYYFYITELGDKIISSVKPYDRREDLRGYYHPHQSWRCVGRAYNNGSSNLTEVTSYFTRYSFDKLRSLSVAEYAPYTDDTIIMSGASWTITLPTAVGNAGKKFQFIHNGTTDTQIYTIATTSSQTISGTTSGSFALRQNGETLEVISDGTNYLVINQRPGAALVPVFACRAYVNFDNSVTTADVSGTYSRTGTTVTVTVTAHGHRVGHMVYADFTTGTAVDGLFIVVSVIDANNFTFTHGTSGATSGNITLKRRAIRGTAGNVQSVTNNVGTGGQFYVNFATAMPDLGYVVCATASGTAGGSTTFNSGAYISEGETLATARTADYIFMKNQTEGGDGQISLTMNSPSVSVAVFR